MTGAASAEIPIWKADTSAAMGVDPVVTAFEVGYFAALAKQHSEEEKQMKQDSNMYAPISGLSSEDSALVREMAQMCLRSDSPLIAGVRSKLVGLLSAPVSDSDPESDALLAKAAELRKADDSLSQYDALVKAASDPAVTAPYRDRTEVLVKSGGHLPAPAGTFAHLGYDPDSTPTKAELERILAKMGC